MKLGKDPVLQIVINKMIYFIIFMSLTGLLMC